MRANAEGVLNGFLSHIKLIAHLQLEQDEQQRRDGERQARREESRRRRDERLQEAEEHDQSERDQAAAVADDDDETVDDTSHGEPDSDKWHGEDWEGQGKGDWVPGQGVIIDYERITEILVEQLRNPLSGEFCSGCGTHRPDIA